MSNLHQHHQRKVYQPIYGHPVGTLVSLQLLTIDPFTSVSCRTVFGPPPRLLSLSALYCTAAMKSLLDIKRSDGLPIIGLSYLQTLEIECNSDHEYKDLERILTVTQKLVHIDCLGVSLFLCNLLRVHKHRSVSARIIYHKLARTLKIKSLPTLSHSQPQKLFPTSSNQSGPLYH
ncbi:hypothetical protein B0H34DRAFT_476915 [Crassisporium funariophilum]|nr:hypothetical protein B0H34DRAFT_476915 [Crassisporium funariophilum]